MKSYIPYFLLLIALFIIGSLIFKESKDNIPTRLDNDRKILLDSLKIINKNLDKIYAQIDGTRNEVLQAKKETEKLRKNYEKIHFVSFSNDSIRKRELSRLYPTYMGN